jgi:hypothetical protein
MSIPRGMDNPPLIANLAMLHSGVTLSIDTCTAIARFLSRLWECTYTRVAYPRVFAEPVPVPIETHTPGHRYGFSEVWVRVALENPKVTCANPYLHSLASSR